MLGVHKTLHWWSLPKMTIVLSSSQWLLDRVNINGKRWNVSTCIFRRKLQSFFSFQKFSIENEWLQGSAECRFHGQDYLKLHWYLQHVQSNQSIECIFVRKNFIEGFPLKNSIIWEQNLVLLQLQRSFRLYWTPNLWVYKFRLSFNEIVQSNRDLRQLIQVKTIQTWTEVQ